MAAAKKVLLVATSHSKLGDTGKDTGYWLGEVAHPFLRLVDAGFTVDMASIGGGKAPVDQGSFKIEGESEAENKRFWVDLKGEEIMNNTTKLSDVDPTQYAAVLFAGGHGTVWDFPSNKDVQRVARSVWEQNGVVAAVCHGPAALVDIPLSNGEQLVKGKKVTGFSNAEEGAAGLTDVVPFLLCDKLAAAGGIVSNGDNWAPFVVVDDRLITGQNPGSAGSVGDAVVAALK